MPDKMETPPWFAEALAAAQSKDRAEVILQDHEFGSMFLAWHVLKLLNREQRKRVMDWLWERIEADDGIGDDEEEDGSQQAETEAQA